MTHMPDIAVAAVDLFGRGGDRNVAFFGVGDRVVPRLNIPFTPWSDDFELRGKSFIGQLEANLIISFSRATVRNGVRAFSECNLDLPLRQKGPCDGGAEQVF